MALKQHTLKNIYISASCYGNHVMLYQKKLLKIYLHHDMLLNQQTLYCITIIWNLTSNPSKKKSASCYDTLPTTLKIYLHDDLVLNKLLYICIMKKHFTNKHFKYVCITIIWHLTNKFFKKYICIMLWHSNKHSKSQ